MATSNQATQKIEILSRGSLNQPAWIRIDQQEYVAFDHDPNTIPVLEDVARELQLKDLPQGMALAPCKRVQFLEEMDTSLEVPLTPSQFDGIAPFRIYSLGRGEAGIILSWHCTKCHWNNEAGHRWKLERARTAVLARRNQFGKIRFHRFVDNGYLAGVEFAVTLKSVSIESVIKTAYEMSKEVTSTIESSIKTKEDSAGSESQFIRSTFIPLLKKLGFKNVIFHHGPREFGKDILFSRQTEFDIPEYWAAQVKLGNVSGKSNSYIDLIVNQAEDAFKIPLYDIQTKSKFWISKFVVLITGKFTDNAVQKICEKIEIHSQRNNIIFLDGEKLNELIQSSGLKKKPKVKSL